jgi:AcrR family transcriptional regulator
MTENWQKTVKNKNRGELISAGKQLYMNHGFLNVKIHDVCRSAGISRVTFYKHFVSLDELTLEIQMEILQDMTHFIQREVTTGMNGLEKLTSILKVWIEYSRLYPGYIKFILLFDLHLESYGSANDIKKRYDDFIRVNMEQHFLLDALNSGIQDGSLKTDMNPAAVAPLIFTSMMGLLQRLSIVVKQDEPQDNQMPQAFVDMLVQYLRA